MAGALTDPIVRFDVHEVFNVRIFIRTDVEPKWFSENLGDLLAHVSERDSWFTSQSGTLTESLLVTGSYSIFKLAVPGGLPPFSSRSNRSFRVCLLDSFQSDSNSN